MRRICTLLIMAAVLVGAPGAAVADLNVVATLPDLAAVAKQVGGEHARVTSLSSSHENPHYVDARPNLIVALNRADLLIVNGLELEIGWLPPLQTQARNSKVIVGGNGYMDVSSHVALLEVPTERIDRAMGDIHPGGNPHFTYDPRAVADIAGAVARKMGELDPANAATYRKNGEEFQQALRDYAAAQTERFSKLPAEKRQVVVYHEAFPYLLDWLRLTRVESIEPKPGVAPSPAHAAKVLQAIKAHHVPVILQQEYYPRNVAKTLADKSGAKLVVVDGATRFEEGESYLDFIKNATEALYAALQS